MSKLEIIRTDPRVIDLIRTVDFRNGNYYGKNTGQQVNVVQQIEPLFPQISRSTIQFALKQLTGRAGPANPVGRPPKVNVLPPACPVEALDAPEQDNGAVAPSEPPAAILSRFELVRRVDRRTAAVSWGYFDTKAWEPLEIIIGSCRETIEEIARLEKQNETITIGTHRNGLPIKITNGEHVEEPDVKGDDEGEDE